MQKHDRPSGPEPNQARAGVAPARACAYAVVRRVFEQQAWADRALYGEARRLQLDSRDLALATQLAFGTVQRVATLDHVIATLAQRPTTKLDAPVLAALRLGVFQLTFLDRIPAHAAVGESVELAKRDAPRGAGLVNAVLRRAAREGRRIIRDLPDRTPAQAALAHSHPEWIAELWFDALGPDDARALMAADNEPAEAVVRANTLKIGAQELAARLPVPNHTENGAVILDAPFDVFGSPEWEQGLLMPQSRAAMAVAELLDPQPGERVLDLCAAPGGKTTHLAALMENTGEIVAVESHPGRAEALRRTAERMGAEIVNVRTADAAEPLDDGTFDRVLIDPPCSDLGTLASRPDARWRKAGRPPELARLQARILAAGAAALRPGGTLVYSTCTISPAENERVVTTFLEANDDFEADDLGSRVPVWKHPTMPQYLQTLPHRDRTDGFFIARLHRA
ncbi:MAG TPA: 16S rRNA (cytosine(967)-C(5))-methyltransferase RsmB [Solirubrobacter sp.]|jgi:16S rRNA (cytosine967-C5)-methyltransferase|nr:16S rRNA (cytosine(967)-C(5))-methyltransferase RsmB [Solirubrobacter sp.]